MSSFLEALRSNRVLLMDGAMGTELQRAGLKEGECGEHWNLTQPEKVWAIHHSFVDAGAVCLLTNTFQVNPATLEKHDLLGEMARINQAAVRIARSACRRGCFVLASLGPTGQDQLPDRMWSGAWFERMLPTLRGVDALLLETHSELGALDVVRFLERSPMKPPDVPILLSLAYTRTEAKGLTTLDGQTPADMAWSAGRSGVAAIGANCGRDIGMDETREIVQAYHSGGRLPVFIRPNAGTPTRIGDGWNYPLSPEMMAERLPDILRAGVKMVGGCCGTTPRHIAAFREVIDEWDLRTRRV